MKKIAFFTLIAFFISTCSHSTSPSEIILHGNFSLTDTSGHSSSQFHSGEEFILKYTLTNSSKETLTYHTGNSGPSIIFRIQKNDSTVASSVDGYVFAAVVITRHLSPGHSLNETWLAPTTPAQDPKVVLEPGEYKALVHYPSFEEAMVDSVAPILFSVVE